MCKNPFVSICYPNSEDVFAQAKQLKYLTDGVFSMGKVRQQYQSVRKWYIENNPTKKVGGIDA